MNLFIRILACLLFFSLSTAAQAQFPDRPIRVVVPLAPGGTGDIFMRALSKELGPVWKQPIVIDNKPGAGTTLGAEIVAKAPPDGYTLLLNVVTGSIGQSAYPKLGYDPIRDFAPITLGFQTPFVLAVNPSLPVSTVAELIAYAKANPGKLNFGSGGNGTMSHMSLELLKTVAGIDIVHVPFKGSSPAAAALVGGQLDGMFDAPPAMLPFVKAGKLKALAVTTRTRASSAPQVPTMIEAGLPGYEVGVWFGLVAPAGTPADIVQKLNVDIARALANPALIESLAQQGMDVRTMRPEEFGAYMRSENVKWTGVVRAAKIRFD